MELTKEQKTDLFNLYQDKLGELVESYIRKHNLRRSQWHDDLIQAAAKGFLEHLNSMPSMDRIWGFRIRSRGEMIKHWKREFPFSLPADRYMETRQSIEIVSYDAIGEAAYYTDDETAMMVEALAEGLGPEQKRALMLKAVYDTPNAELQGILGTNRAGVTRFFRKLRPRAREYFGMNYGANA